MAFRDRFIFDEEDEEKLTGLVNIEHEDEFNTFT